MKISEISVTTMILLTGAFLATSCATDVETEINTDPKGNAISFSPSVGHTSRATEINIKNLGDFAVVARGMHPDGVLYDSYLIGHPKDGGEIAKFEKLNSSTEPTSGIWKLDRSVYWPSSLQRVFFIGYTTLTRDKDNKDQSEDSSNGVLGEATFSVSQDKPSISGFKPLKDDLTQTKEGGIWADGESQKDLLVTFKAQNQGTNTTVDLNFRHALTQVSIKAEQKGLDSDNDHRIVKIKGAWIVNAAKSGTLTADISINKESEDKTVTNKTSWSMEGTETYGAYYNDIVYPGSDVDLLRHSLMLIPQSLTAWDKNNAGAYIMLLCRVELEHKGSTHGPDTNITDIAIIEGEGEKGKHYHQLFPVNTEKYNGAQYGFVCVPLLTDWGDSVEGQDDCKGAGKHYTYNLDICGAETGAGLYPPMQDVSKLIPDGATVSALVLNADKTYETKTVDLEVVQTRPDNKNIGDKVLDDPIKFSVTVDSWKAPDNWTDGDLEL